MHAIIVYENVKIGITKIKFVWEKFFKVCTQLSYKKN